MRTLTKIKKLIEKSKTGMIVLVKDSSLEKIAFQCSLGKHPFLVLDRCKYKAYPNLVYYFIRQE